MSQSASSAAGYADNDIPASAACRERLFAGVDAPARRLVAALAPLRLRLEPSEAGVRARGDMSAIELAKAFILRFTDALEQDAAATPALIAETIDEELKHELAYRLPGLPHAVRPMSLAQVAFMDSMLRAESGLIFGVGPAGTGKTLLAIAAGLALVAEGRFKSFKMTRPHVLLEGEVMTPTLRAETGGDGQLSVLDDVMADLISHDESERLKAHGAVEVLPLGALRGRTFNDAVILVDEAQNMTRAKMRMALTRLGRRSLMIVTGDPSQSDLRDGEVSGLTHVLGLIEGSGVAEVHRFQTGDIVRNEVVARIEGLYESETAPARQRPRAA
ncbi:PhoH family protein [Phenylobacterium sp.]|uniref:PhoH family protein n=1 Tax=Phenylobacterium sp. TaxID=1871053 RepID=UPI0035B1AE42